MLCAPVYFEYIPRRGVNDGDGDAIWIEIRRKARWRMHRWNLLRYRLGSCGSYNARFSCSLVTNHHDSDAGSGTGA